MGGTQGSTSLEGGAWSCAAGSCCTERKDCRAVSMRPASPFPGACWQTKISPPGLAQRRAGPPPGCAGRVAKPGKALEGHPQRFTPSSPPKTVPCSRPWRSCRMQSDNVAIACFPAETLFGFSVACGAMRLQAPGRGVLLGGDHFGSHLRNCFQVFGRPRFKM